MGKAGGFIALQKQILSWEWYKDSSTKDLFIHLLLIVNFADSVFQGRTIKRGQIVRSLPTLSTETGLSIQQIRTALSHLISTGEITEESYPRYRIITVVKYDDYQKLTDKSTGSQHEDNTTSNSQSTGSATGNQQRNNNITNINNKTNKSLTRFIPPTLDEIRAYIQEIKSSVDPEEFFDYYQQCGWVLNGGKKMKDWKASVRNWERRRKNGLQHNGPGRNHEDVNGSEEQHRSKYAWLRDTVIHC